MDAPQFILYFSAVSGFTSWVQGIMENVAQIRQSGVGISDVMELISYEEPYRFEDGEPLPKNAAAALLFTFSIMSNVLVLIEDGKKVSVIEIVQNAFKTPAFLAVILGILASVSGLMNGFMLSPAGVIWTTMKDMITAAMSPMILLVVGYEVQLNRELLGTCLKTVIIRAVMQLIFAIAAISLIHILGRSDRLLEIAIIVYMSIPGSMGIQAFIKDEDGKVYSKL